MKKIITTMIILAIIPLTMISNTAMAHQWKEKEIIKHKGTKWVVVKKCNEHKVKHHKFVTKCKVVKKYRSY